MIPAPTNGLPPPPCASLLVQTTRPVAALTAMTVALLVPVKTQPSASTGTDWIVPPSGIASCQASFSLSTFALPIAVSAVWLWWLSSVLP